MKWTWLRNGYIERQNESPLIAVQNNTLKTIYMKAKVYNKRKNRKSRLFDDREENSYWYDK